MADTPIKSNEESKLDIYLDGDRVQQYRISKSYAEKYLKNIQNTMLLALEKTGNQNQDDTIQVESLEQLTEIMSEIDDETKFQDNPRNHEDFAVLTRQSGKIMAEYIWIGGNGLDIRSKCKTLGGPIKSLSELPDWNFDGSSTNQADGHYSEIWLKPVKYVNDPFRKRPNILVLCECLDAKTMKPLESNRRAPANIIFENKLVKDEIPWYGIEQEYTLFQENAVTPLGWPKNGFPAPQGPYYCGIGANRAFGREVVEAHYRACLYAQLDIAGINAEVMPGQWEFQVGPCTGIDSGDQLWLSRYILERVAEDFKVCVSFDPKPIRGDWNGAGAHTNYSTKSMRTNPKTLPKNNNKNSNDKDNKLYGFNEILKAIGKLAGQHLKHMKVYGKGNQARLTGKYETAKYDQFSYGVANRGASVRIPRMSQIDGFGYFEDRRPAANCDPYDVTAIIAETTLLS